MLPAISIGFASLPTRPVLMLVAFFLCLIWTERRLPRHGLDKDLAFNAGYLFGGVTVAAGRIWYATTHWAAYEANPLGLVSTSISTIAFSEGAVFGGLAVFGYLLIKRISLAVFADAFTPGLLMLFALASLGALASGDAFGTPADVPWAITLWSERRHPSQVYEAAVALVSLAVILRAKPMRDGGMLLAAAAIYGSGRVFIEAYRGDSWLIGEGVRAMQVVWLAAAVAALVLLARQAPASSPPHEQGTDPPREQTESDFGRGVVGTTGPP